MMLPRSAPLKGLLVDDSPYWRDRLPCWLTKFSIELVSFKNYAELFRNPADLERHDLIIGDFRIRGVRNNGFNAMNNLRESYNGMKKTYILMSVLPEHEIAERIGAQVLPSWLTFINKDTSPGRVAELIFSATKPRVIVESGV